jgi:hypothetical protein
VKPRQAATPIILIVLATGVAAYAYLVDRGTISDADRATRRRDVFPTFRVDEVTRVELVQDSGSLRLERGAGDSAGAATWTMTFPGGQGAADPGAVDALLRELEGAVRLRDVDDTIDAGLGSPRVRGTVAMGPLVLRFALGADAPRPEGAAYMRVEGEGAFVVGRSLRAQLLRDPDAYRPRMLVPYGESQVARLEVVRPGTAFTLERHGATFRLAESGARASRDAVDRLFTALADARADTFIDEKAAMAALGPDPIRVSITPVERGGPRLELRLGGECPGQPGEIVALRTPEPRLSACVARSLGEAFGTNAATLVDASPFFAHADELEDIRLEDLAGGLRVELARSGSGWHERAPEDRELSPDESESANLLASALAATRADEVLAPKASVGHAFVARGKATVVRTGGSITEIVELGAPGADGTAWEKRLDDGALLRLSAASARHLQPHPVALRSREVWRTPIDPGDVVTLESTCGAPEKLDWRNGAWSLEAPAGFAADPIAAADLASALARARAEAFVAEADDGFFGLSDPGACRASMTVGGHGDAGERHASITFGAATEDGVYARASDDPAVFVAPAVLRALATHPVLERRRFQLDRASLSTLAAVRDGVRREVSTGTDAESAVADALSSLVVRAALHTGRATPAEGFDRPGLEIDATYRSDAGALSSTRLWFGASTNVDGEGGYFARVSGLDATFFVLRPAVDAAIAALGAPRSTPPGVEGATGLGSAP